MEDSEEAVKTEETNDEYVIPPGAVKPSATEEKEAEPSEDESSEEEATESEEVEEANPQKVEQPTQPTEPAATDPETIEIDGKQFSREEVEKVFSLGKSVYEYQREHPGFDPLLLERDYRVKTAKLAEYERKFGKPSEADPNTEHQKKAEKPEADLSDIHPEDVSKIEKVLKARGYVSREELRKQDYEKTKQEAVNAFLETHPEYHPKNDSGDVKWNSLLKEFNLYRLPDDPRRVRDLLERAHKSIASGSIDPKSAARIIAQKKANKVGTEAGSGGQGGTVTAASKTQPKKPSQAMQTAKWLKGFSEEEINEILS